MDKIRISALKGNEVSIELPPSRSYIKELNEIASADKFDNLVQEGISYYSVKPVFDILSLNQAEQATLIGVESRTISNWVKRDQLLSKTEAMQMIEIDRIIQSGVVIFGTEESFLNWFNTKNEAFGGKSPKELILRPSGLETVQETLNAMEYGNIL